MWFYILCKKILVILILGDIENVICSSDFYMGKQTTCSWVAHPMVHWFRNCTLWFGISISIWVWYFIVFWEGVSFCFWATWKHDVSCCDQHYHIYLAGGWENSVSQRSAELDSCLSKLLLIVILFNPSFREPSVWHDFDAHKPFIFELPLQVSLYKFMYNWIMIFYVKI